MCERTPAIAEVTLKGGPHLFEWNSQQKDYVGIPEGWLDSNVVLQLQKLGMTT